MGDGKIHIPGKKRKPLQAGQAPIIRISVEAYNTLVAVSYTHLDVYKRQASDPSGGRGRP